MDIFVLFTCLKGDIFSSSEHELPSAFSSPLSSHPGEYFLLLSVHAHPKYLLRNLRRILQGKHQQCTFFTKESYRVRSDCCWAKCLCVGASASVSSPQVGVAGIIGHWVYLLLLGDVTVELEWKRDSFLLGIMQGVQFSLQDGILNPEGWMRNEAIWGNTGHLKNDIFLSIFPFLF